MSRTIFLTTLVLASAGWAVPTLTTLSLPTVTPVATAVPLLVLVVWEVLRSNYGQVEMLRIELRQAEQEGARLQTQLVARHPAIRVGFVIATQPQDLLDTITLYPRWPDGTDRLSTRECFAVRAYNGGPGTARQMLMTFGLPAGVAVHSATGLPYDVTRMMQGLHQGTRFATPAPNMNPGIQSDVQFCVEVRPGLPRFVIGYSVAMEDEQAVSGELLVEVSQLAVPTS